MRTTSIHQTNHRTRASATPKGRFALAVAAGCLAVVTLPMVASANEGHPGCNGLYETARFRTAQQVGETHGHDTVHHVFERLGCGGHHD